MERVVRSNDQNGIDNLVVQIQTTSSILQHHALTAINKDVTTRAWLTGFFIVEYEQNGSDRAAYGDNLINELSKLLGRSSHSPTNLRFYRSVYLLFPELGSPILHYLETMIQKDETSFEHIRLIDPIAEKQRTLSVISSQTTDIQVSDDGFAMITEEGIVVPVAQMVFERLSLSNLSLLVKIKRPIERAFYAIESMRGPWSYRELKRQIDSNYFQRSGWSKNPRKLAKKLIGKNEKPSLREEIKSPFTFEFLGLTAKEVIEESDVENALMDHLQEFIMELGLGFCLEARQKKVLIDERYYKVDLVFYHRILKCHCLIELKARRLDYSDIAQLNMYIEYYKRHYMQPDDNPPVGLLLCTEYGKEMVEYLAPFIDPKLFVAKYELELPDKRVIKEFLMRENKSM